MLWQDMEGGIRQQATCLRADLAQSLQENRELQERLMVSEATVQAQAEQLKEYRDLLSESLRGAYVRVHWHQIKMLIFPCLCSRDICPAGQ